MRPTPETDAFSVKFKSVCGSKDWVPTDICRRLERERDKAREERDIARLEFEEISNDLKDARNKIWRLENQIEGLNNFANERYEEIQSVRKERDDAREQAEHWKVEYEIVVDRLRGRKHPRDNGIIASDEIIPKLERERDEARDLADRYRVAFCSAKGDLVPQVFPWEDSK